MDKEKSEFIELEVAEALQEDIDKGIVRISSDIMNRYRLISGDIVELKAKDGTAVRVMRSIKKDADKNIIRLDGTTRSNIGASIGDLIQVKKTKIEEAKKITLSPLQEVQFSDDPTEYFHTKLMHKTLSLNQKTVIDVFGTRLEYVVSKLEPKNYVIVIPSTKIIVSDLPYKGDLKGTGISYEDIGGLKQEVELVREMVELPMKHPEVFQKLGVGAPKGVLLTGPPGTGKTLLAKAVANETDSSFFSIAGPEIMSKYYGESEKHLRDIFEQAEKNAPSIIFIDEIDSIAPKRGDTDQTEKRIVAQILTLMDGLKTRGQVVVMAATNRPDDIDEALRRPGRFDRELKINPPDEIGRKEILQIHTRGMPLDNDVNFDEIAYKTIGFTGADIEVLCKEAALKSIKPYFVQLKNIQEKVPTNILDKIKVGRQHFLDSLKIVEPSALREVLIQKPHVNWDDIGGLEDAKEKLRELVELPLLRPDLFEIAGIKPSKGILLTGPSGTGKTLLAKAVANESNANFISVKGPELISKWVGESLPYDEKVLTIENGFVDFKKIGEIVENKVNNLMAPTMKDNFRAKNSKVTDLIKHSAPSHIDIIKTKTGRKVRVTGGHSLFVKENDSFKEVIAEDIIPGKTYIAIPRKLTPVETIKSINILDYLSIDDYKLYVKNGQKYVKDAISILGKKRVAEIMKTEEKNIYVYSKKSSIRVAKFIELMKESKIKYDQNSILLKGNRQSKSMPAKLNFGKGLCTFLGLWVADGSYNTKYSVRLRVSKEESKFAIDLCKKLFGHVTVYRKGNGIDITIGSRFLYVIMREILKMMHNSEKKNVPRIIFSLPKESIAAFLSGYFGGDGYFSGKQIEASTTNKELVNSLLILLLYFGIVANYKTKKEWNNTVSHRISFIWQDFLRIFLREIRFCYEYKNKKVKKYLKSLWIKRDNLKPKIDKDVYWDLVIDKRREKYTMPFVYDIGINPTHRFIAGFGGVLVHNSEKRVREIFKKARQVAPSIIFFDEFDSISKIRGSTLSDATERVVNQLLTELDGIEELEKVVVIAATNRKDLIDPALIRPGRIDSIIELQIPDKETRKKIFEVHTKKMPLDKSIKLDEYIDKTDGWTGADIEAVTRNAGINAIKRHYKQSKKGEFKIIKEDFDNSLDYLSKSTSKILLKKKL